MKCTWKDCSAEGVHPQLDRDQRPWEHLCDAHHIELEQAIASLDPKRLVAAWIKAQGGAKAATKRTMRG